jgi:hypothetical protein
VELLHGSALVRLVGDDVGEEYDGMVVDKEGEYDGFDVDVGKYDVEGESELVDEDVGDLLLLLVDKE